MSDKDVLCALDGFGFGRFDAKNEDKNAFLASFWANFCVGCLVGVGLVSFSGAD